MSSSINDIDIDFNKDLEEVKKEAKQRSRLEILIRTTDICKRLCQLAFIQDDKGFEYDYIMLIIYDRFKNPRVAKQVYNILKHIGFLEEQVIGDYYMGEELKRPMRSKKFRKILKKYKINDLSEITPEIAKQITLETQFWVTIEDNKVKVYPKLDKINVKLTNLAKEICIEITNPLQEI